MSKEINTPPSPTTAPRGLGGATAEPLLPQASPSTFAGASSGAGASGALRNLGGPSARLPREVVTPPEAIPQRDKDLATLMQATVTPTARAQGFTPVVLDAEQAAALKLDDLGLTVDDNGFITSGAGGSGFRARLFQDQAGLYVLSISGSDRTDAGDWNNNVRQALGARANQYDQAMGLALNVKAAYGANFTEITGGSLGGGLATAAAAVSGVPATTFNAAGLNPATVRRFLAARGEGALFDERWKAVNENTTNYHVLGDALTHLQTDLDPGKVLPDAVGKQLTISAVGEDGAIHNQYTPEDIGWRMRYRTSLHLPASILRGLGVSA